MRTAALVACGNSKRDERCPAYSLYDSVLFEKSMSAAMLLGHPYVMSSKHGLLAVDDRVDPYDDYLGNKTDAEKTQWATEVAVSLSSQYRRVFLFGGRDYVETLKNELAAEGRSVIDVYENTSGNGQQMAVAGDIVENMKYGMTPLEAVHDAR